MCVGRGGEGGDLTSLNKPLSHSVCILQPSLFSSLQRDIFLLTCSASCLSALIEKKEKDGIKLESAE